MDRIFVNLDAAQRAFLFDNLPHHSFGAHHLACFSVLQHHVQSEDARAVHVSCAMRPQQVTYQVEAFDDVVEGAGQQQKTAIHVNNNTLNVDFGLGPN